MKIIVFGFPHNPTAQVGEQSWLDDAMACGVRHQVVIAHDNPYVDLSLEGDAPSLLNCDGWKEFVEAHYYYSRRTDTPFWKHVTQDTRYDIQGAHDLVQFHMVGGDPVQHEAHPILYILGGAGYTSVRRRSYQYFDYPPVPSQKVDEWNHLYLKRKKLAESLPTMYKYLQDTIFS